MDVLFVNYILELFKQIGLRFTCKHNYLQVPVAKELFVSSAFPNCTG